MTKVVCEIRIREQRIERLQRLMALGLVTGAACAARSLNKQLLDDTVSCLDRLSDDIKEERACVEALKMEMGLLDVLVWKLTGGSHV